MPILVNHMAHKKGSGNWPMGTESKAGALCGRGTGYNSTFGGIILLFWLTSIMFKDKANCVNF